MCAFVEVGQTHHQRQVVQPPNLQNQAGHPSNTLEPTSSAFKWFLLILSYWFFHRVRWFRISAFLKVLKASSDFGCEELHRRDQSSELQFRRCSFSKAGNTWEGHLKRDLSERNADQKCAALLLHVTSRCWWSCTILHILLAWRIEFSVFYWNTYDELWSATKCKHTRRIINWGFCKPTVLAQDPRSDSTKCVLTDKTLLGPPTGEKDSKASKVSPNHQTKDDLRIKHGTNFTSMQHHSWHAVRLFKVPDAKHPPFEGLQAVQLGLCFANLVKVSVSQSVTPWVRILFVWMYLCI